MKLGGRLVRGRFLARINRFAARIRVDGHEVLAHVPNSGRLRELLLKESQVVLVWRGEGDGRDTGRKTEYDLAVVRYGGRWVSIDARLPVRLLADAAAGGRLEPFSGWPFVRAEVKVGNSRLDLALTSGEGKMCYIEAKSVTLVENGRALFPDAPTVRGTRHLEELTRIVGGGQRGSVIFVVQRDDATLFSPNDRTDPAFGRALRVAAMNGVEVYAFRCHVTEEEIELYDEITVEL